MLVDNCNNGSSACADNDNSTSISSDIKMVAPSSADERMDAAWEKTERESNNNKRTSPPKSPLERDVIEEGDEEDVENIGDIVVIRDTILSEHDISPLMDYPSDITLQTCNMTSLMQQQPSNNNNCYSAAHTNSTISTINQVHDTSHSDISCKKKNNKQVLSSNTTMLQKYRNFLQKHSLSIDFLEHIMERFFLYGYLYKQHDNNSNNTGIFSTELYYAIWNSIRWCNDVILVGYGEGMGMTVGRREEWLGCQEGKASPSSSSSSLNFSEWILSRLNSAVPILRAILTATTCIYPAMEAWSRRSTIHSSRRINDENNNNGEITKQQFRTAQVSYRLERIKFVVRLALLSISWWARQQNHQRRNITNEKNINDTAEGGSMIPSLLRRGGELDPYEQLVPLKEAEDEAKVVQYVGKRTGRRSVARSSQSTVRSTTSASSVSSKISTLVKWLTKLLPSKHKILYVYAVGELLHILRPLYWSHSEKVQWQRRQLSSSSIKILPSQKKQSTLDSSYNFGIWKAWFISLIMDLISDKLLQSSDNNEDGSTMSYSMRSTSRRGPLLKGRRHAQGRNITSAEQAKIDELDWRRSRHGLYLLRSPMYNALTRPVAVFIGRIVAMIPSFGLGSWAAEYVLDMMSYWNENHFMLES